MKCKITVLRKTLHKDFAETYCQREVGLCEAFEEGQEFIFENLKPEKFCSWAWNDIYKVVLTLMQGGNFGSTWKWMKEDNTMIACCTDGIRPVIFKIERIDD
ncbi:MAG: TIGR04076 family protein [Promethearchaeota archaeon]